MSAATISIVIPALDEEAGIARAVRSVVSGACEVVVVDGGSRDRTREIAAAEGARVMVAPPGRGGQLDAGARECRGHWLVFLHADTWLEDGWADALRAVGDGVTGGAFRFAIDSPRRAYRLLEAGVGWRCRWLALPYGDQALFVRRAAYAALGGFPPLPLMEDVAFVRRLRRAGPLALLGPRAWTSARRWEDRGIAATTLRNTWLLGLYLAGRAPERLARSYGRGTAPP